jgi:hypothetical protein
MQSIDSILETFEADLNGHDYYQFWSHQISIDLSMCLCIYLCIHLSALLYSLSPFTIDGPCCCSFLQVDPPH